MPDQKKTTDRGVVDSIARLREQRYMTKGLGAVEQARRDGRASQKTAMKKLPTVDQLRDQVSKVAVKVRKKKSKQRRKA